jgi:hypothetical protein
MHTVSRSTSCTPLFSWRSCSSTSPPRLTTVPSTASCGRLGVGACVGVRRGPGAFLAWQQPHRNPHLPRPLLHWLNTPQPPNPSQPPWPRPPNLQVVHTLAEALEVDAARGVAPVGGAHRKAGADAERLGGRVGGVGTGCGGGGRVRGDCSDWHRRAPGAALPRRCNRPEGASKQEGPTRGASGPHLLLPAWHRLRVAPAAARRRVGRRRQAAPRDAVDGAVGSEHGDDLGVTGGGGKCEGAGFGCVGLPRRVPCCEGVPPL